MTKKRKRTEAVRRPQGGGLPATVTPYRSVLRPGHPLADKDGRVKVHRLVLYEKVGEGEHNCHWCRRPLRWDGSGRSRLLPDHLDNDGWNNRPENLVPACCWCNGARGKRPDFLTHCDHGHEYTKANTYLRPDGGGRVCRECSKRREQTRSRRVKAVKPV